METNFSVIPNLNPKDPKFQYDLEEQEEKEFLAQLDLKEREPQKLVGTSLFPCDDYKIIYLPEKYDYYLELDLEYFLFLPGIFNITLDDLTEIISKDKPNYLSMGQSEDDLIKAFDNALKNLPHGLDGVGGLFVMIYFTRRFESDNNNENSLSAKDFKRLDNLIRSLTPGADLLIGFDPHGAKTGQISKFRVYILTHY